MAYAKINTITNANMAKVDSIVKANIGKISSIAAPASFVDANAVSKSITTGTAQAIYFTDTADTFNFIETEAWTISFWVKAGWSASLNTNIHFFIGQKTSATYQLSDMIKMQYNEDSNRLYAIYGNKTTSENAKKKEMYWLFHTNSGTYATAYAAAGLGTTYWSAANRGNVGDDDFTMITMTKAAADAASSVKVYWNAATLGTPTVTKDETLAVGMSETSNRLWSLGANGIHGSNDQTKSGDSAETVYNDLSFWNAELTAAEVSELYNSGTRLNAETHSAQGNLIGYWKFESDGSATRPSGVSEKTFTIAGNSNIASV